MSALESGFERLVARVGHGTWLGRKLEDRAGAVTRARTSGELELEAAIAGGPRTLRMSHPLLRVPDFSEPSAQR